MYSWALPAEKQKRGWHIYNVETNYETGRDYSHYISTIKYCPFCGEELKDELSE